MTALPDGTYLILNGAEQGQAGFGLAINPNHNAVLYDPSKPLGSRMTIMADTTIDRLYHSEAVLLLDGRVLVSGSDPEDTRFEQEYRVETYTPPYLLSGLPVPEYTIHDKDWDYGESYTIVLSSNSTQNFTGGASQKLTARASQNLKVSLLGAVSSTHGNSMGQRTIFPEFTCAGETCQISAPPNAKICPPGWFMLFVLDNGVPSIGQWVRIGGDPARLGEWPNFPDFDVPGV
jgi:Domain of unknown function (DUF1929)